MQCINSIEKSTCWLLLYSTATAQTASTSVVYVCQQSTDHCSCSYAPLKATVDFLSFRLPYSPKRPLLVHTPIFSHLLSLFTEARKFPYFIMGYFPRLTSKKNYGHCSAPSTNTFQGSAAIYCLLLWQMSMNTFGYFIICRQTLFNVWKWAAENIP